MKKLLPLLLILCLCFGTACAGANVETRVFDIYYAELNQDSDVLIIQEEYGGPKYIADLNLNKLSDGYAYISQRGEFFEVGNEEMKHGLADSQGKVIVPLEYGDVKVLSDRWFAGLTYTNGTEEENDKKVYSGDDTFYYLVDTADIFYRDEKVGTLPRDEWGYTETAGDYIRIENKEGLKNWYNKSFIKSDAPDSFSREYRRDDDTGAMLHLGSNQEAFVPGCTLVPEEVRQSIRISPDMKILDLQGNVLGDLSAYQDASLDVDSGFIVVTNKKGKQGVVGRTGIDLIPCKYDHVEGMDCLNLSGVIYAERDGKSGWVHVEDGTETSFKFPADYAMRTSNFILIDDGQDVGYILISADGGQLDRHFRDVTASSVPRAAGNKIAMVAEMDGTCRIIGQYGEEILPGVTFGSMYNATISYDGTVVTTRDMNTNQFIVYLIDYSPY